MNSILTQRNNIGRHRVEWVDIFRGIGILLMILGHSGFRGYFDKWIHTFHMPMFFFISGFLFDVEKCKKMNLLIYVQRKFKTLIVPYIIFGIISLGLWTALKGFEFNSLKALIWNTDGIPISGALWFLTALFIADIMYFSIQKWVAPVSFKIVIIIVISLIGCLAPYIHISISFPFALAPACVGVGFMYLGGVFKHNYSFTSEIIESTNIIIVLLFAVAATLLMLLNDDVNMRTSNYGNIFVFWVDALLWIIVFVEVSTSLDNLKCIVISFIKGIGKDSITYVCLNQLVLYGIGFFINRINLQCNISHIIQFVFGMVILTICNYIIMKSPFCLLFGK